MQIEISNEPVTLSRKVSQKLRTYAALVQIEPQQIAELFSTAMLAVFFHTIGKHQDATNVRTWNRRLAMCRSALAAALLGLLLWFWLR